MANEWHLSVNGYMAHCSDGWYWVRGWHWLQCIDCGARIDGQQEDDVVRQARRQGWRANGEGSVICPTCLEVREIDETEDEEAVQRERERVAQMAAKGGTGNG
jgi:hypothetical protein